MLKEAHESTSDRVGKQVLFDTAGCDLRRRLFHCPSNKRFGQGFSARISVIPGVPLWTVPSAPQAGAGLFIVPLRTGAVRAGFPPGLALARFQALRSPLLGRRE